MDVEARARTLAALADPLRLRIVDSLAAGDASPKELQGLLAISSNLLAHHVGVLEARGIVSRHRSHADRRRTYLHLEARALAGLLPADRLALDVDRVVFVCTANSARSQLAAALWRRASTIPVLSAGTHPADAVAVGAVDVAGRRGLRLLRARPQSLQGLLRAGDFVVTVCDGAHEELGPEDLAVVAGAAHWSVEDPVAVGTDAAFDRAFDDLAGRVTDLAPRLSTVAS